MDVVKYLEQVEHKEFNKWKAKAYGISVEEYLNATDSDNSEKKVCGKFKMTNLYSFNKGEDS